MREMQTTHKEIPPYNHRMAIIKKNTKHKITNNDEDVEKLENSIALLEKQNNTVAVENSI